MKEISVIIPCYNVEALIGRCLDSILSQTVGLDSLEIICVDDCSTDKTPAVLHRYEQQYPEHLLVVLLDKNGKQGRARNIGMSYASGQYITFVDADDCVAPQMLETLLAYSQRYNSDIVECDLCQFAERIPEAATEGTALQLCMERQADKKWYLLNRGWKTGPCGRLYRREFLAKFDIAFPEDTFMEDIYFSGKCMMHMRDYILLPQAYYFYYVNQHGTMFGEGMKNHYMDTFYMQEKTTDLLRENHWYDDCEEEYAYLHFTKAFVEPVSRMLAGEVDFSYENYLLLRKRQLEYFPNIAENVYVKQGSVEDVSICRQLLQYDFTETQLRKILMGDEYDEKDKRDCSVS